MDRYRLVGPGSTERERAELERQIYVQAVGDGEVRGVTGRVWLGRTLGVVSSLIACRELILRHESSLLWSRVDGGMSLYTARNLAKAAKAQAELVGTTYEKALETVLAEYESLPLSRSSSGKSYRRRPQGHTQVVATDRSSVPRKPSKEPEAAGTGRSDWFVVREAVWGLVEQRIEGVPAMDAARLKADFERGLATLFDEMQLRLKRQRINIAREGELSKLLTRKALVSACRTLCMDPPPVGKPVDLALGNRNKKRLARLYHPDAHGGSEGMRDRYEEVLAAYEVLVQFTELSNPETKPTIGDP